MTSRWLILAIAIGQSCPAPLPRSVLSTEHLAIIRAESLAPVVRVRDLPISVREALRLGFDESSLQLADPQASSQRFTMTPWRRSRHLIVAGCGPDHCLVHYEHREYGRSFHIVVLGLNEDNAQAEWSGFASKGLTDLSDVKALVLKSAAGRSAASHPDDRPE